MELSYVSIGQSALFFRGTREMNRDRLSYALPIGLLCFVYVGYVLYPLMAIVQESLMMNGNFSFGNYLEMASLRNSANVEAVWNSILVSFLSVAGSCVVGVFFAFVFTQLDFPFRGFFSRIAILPIALPPLVGVISFLFVFGETGILPRVASEFFGLPIGTLSLDGFAAIVAVHTYSFYVYFYLFVSTTLRNLDASVLEASQILGGSSWRTIRRIIFPELKPALLGASILAFMASMASFSAPLLFGGDKRFMTLQIYNAKLNGEINVASALAIVLTLVSIVFFVAFRIITPSSGTRAAKGAGKIGVVGIGRSWRRLFVTLAIVMLAIELFPIVIIIVLSFAKEGSWTWQIVPAVYTLENYVKLMSEPQVFDPILNSLVMSCMTVVAAVLVGVSAAYLITKGKLGRSRFAVDILATLPYAIPGTVIAISLILAFNKPTWFSAQTILVGTFWILPIAYFVRMFPLVVRSTSASLEQLDDSQLEAGQTFGAGAWRRFRTIVLPIILPGIISGALLVMITALGEFVSSILLYSYSNRPISVEILAQMRTYNFGAAAAYSVLLLVLILGLIFVSELIGKMGTRQETTLNI